MRAAELLGGQADAICLTSVSEHLEHVAAEVDIQRTQAAGAGV